MVDSCSRSSIESKIIKKCQFEEPNCNTMVGPREKLPSSYKAKSNYIDFSTKYLCNKITVGLLYKIGKKQIYCISNYSRKRNK